MKLRFSLVCLIAAGLFAVQANAQSFTDVDGSTTAGPYNENGGPIALNPDHLTQSVDESVVIPGSVSCNAGGLHTDNSFLRRFDTSVLPNGFNVKDVDMGIETATGATGTQDLFVNVYSIANGDAFLFANLVLQGTSGAVPIPDQSLTLINVIVAAAIPAGDDMVLEIFTPDGQAAGNSLFIGSNNLGETAAGYIAAAECGLPEPLPLGDIGFPDMHILLAANGEGDPGCVFRMGIPNQEVDVDSPLEFRIHLEHNRPVTVTRALFMEILDESGTVLYHRQTQERTFNYLDVVDRRFSVNLPPAIVPGDYTLAVGLSGMAQGRVEVERAFTVVADGARQSAPESVSLPGTVEHVVGEWSEVAGPGELPSAYALMQNYPNPFNPSTEIGFTLPESANVRLAVYDVLGRQVQLLIDGTMEAGTHEVLFDAGNLPSGTYLYRLETPQGSVVRTMLLAK